MVAPALIAAGIGAGITGAQAIGAYGRQRKLEKQLADLPEIKYRAAAPTLSYYSQALQESMSPQGLSPQERGAYLGDIARGETVATRTAQNIGAPGSAVNYLVNAIGQGGRTNLARIEAGRRFGNRQAAFGRIGSAVSTLQNIENQNTGLDIMEQQALGKAASDARMTANYSLGSLSSGALGAAGYMYGSTPFQGAPDFSQTATTTPIPTYPPQTVGYTPSVLNQYKPQLYSGFTAYGRPRTATSWMSQPFIYQ